MLKSQDIVIALKLLAMGRRPWTYQSLAHELYLSPSQVYAGFKGAAASRLIDQTQRMPMPHHLCEFLLHGIEYAFPARPGELTRGMPTSYSAPPLSERIQFSEREQLVWPDAEGEVSGQSLAPLYRSVPQAARKDAMLYELLTLVDALRGAGKARERQLAKEMLENRIMGYHATEKITLG
jgi:hypothetical protein